MILLFFFIAVALISCMLLICEKNTPLQYTVYEPLLTTHEYEDSHSIDRCIEQVENHRKTLIELEPANAIESEEGNLTNWDIL